MSDETPEIKLTPKQRVFIDEYLRCFNATRAAIAAGYSEKTAYSIGSELLRKNYIADRIDKEISARKYISRNNAQKKVSNYVYLMREDAFNLVKIGISGNPEIRLSNLQTSCPQNITLIGAIKTNRAKEIESELHAKYKHKHHRGEWFRLSDKDIQDLLEEWKNYQPNTKNLSTNTSSASTQQTLI